MLLKNCFLLLNLITSHYLAYSDIIHSLRSNKNRNKIN